MASSRSGKKTTSKRLLQAARYGNVTKIKKLVKELDDGRGLAETIDDVRDKDGRGLLHHAAAEGMTNVCKYLIEKLELNVNLKDDEEFTPFLVAIMRGHLSTATCLLENGADPCASIRYNTTALFIASGIGNIELIRLLLSKGADVASQSNFGTPLQVAAIFCKEDIVKILLEHGANPNSFVTHLTSPLIASVSKSSLQCTKLLIEAGASPNDVSCGSTPLAAAAVQGEPEIIKYLLEIGADPNIANTVGHKPIEVAATCFNCQAVSILFPVTSPIPAYPEWNIIGIMRHVHSEEGRQQLKHKKEDKFLKAKSKAEDAFRRKEYTAAILYYTEAMSVNCIDASVLSNRSLCWACLKDGGFALADAKNCIKLSPYWAEAYYREGFAYTLLKEFDSAANAFLEGLKLDPQNNELRVAFREAIEARTPATCKKNDDADMQLIGKDTLVR